MKYKSLKPKANLSVSIPVGIHLLTIVKFQSKKDAKGNPIVDGNGNIQAISVTFQDSKNRQKVKHFPLTEKMLWMLENFSNALNIDLVKGKEYDVDTDVIGRQVWGVMHVVQLCRGGEPIIDDKGNIESFVDMSSKFYEAHEDGSGPVLAGNPSRNDPTGHFLVKIEKK